MLGNFPQALSQIGVINAASAIGEAERRGKRRPRIGNRPGRDSVALGNTTSPIVDD
jgi:hypothetical protein